MLTRAPGGSRLSERGSGTAIGVTILFPALMLVIVSLQMLSDSARIEQGLQAAANRAARTASLCCHHTGGPNGAEAVVEASLRAAESADVYNRIFCTNDFVADSSVVFLDVAGSHVPNQPDASGAYRAVPPGGTVHVFVRCHIPPQSLGGFGVPGLNAVRLVEGVASIDPYRYRGGA